MNKNRVVCDQNETLYHVEDFKFTPKLAFATRYTEDEADQWRKWLNAKPYSGHTYTHRIVSSIVHHPIRGQS